MDRFEGEVFFPRFLTITDVEWDHDGFRARDSEETIRWSDIVQVAILYQIHPIAIVDWNYLAFRLCDAELSVWVEIKKDETFAAEVERRFAPLAVPGMAAWKDEETCIRSYSIWPKERTGEPLYVNRRKNWRSWSKYLALPKRPNQAPEATATCCRDLS